jgi:hypothetical protein
VHKHKYTIEKAAIHWASHSTNDKDFEVALLAKNYGELFTDTVFVDRTFLKNEMQQQLLQHHIIEKTELDVNYSFLDIEKIIKKAQEEVVVEFQEIMFPKALWNRIIDEIKPVEEKIEKKKPKKSFHKRVLSFMKRKIKILLKK